MNWSVAVAGVVWYAYEGGGWLKWREASKGGAGPSEKRFKLYRWMACIVSSMHLEDRGGREKSRNQNLGFRILRESEHKSEYVKLLTTRRTRGFCGLMTSMRSESEYILEIQ